MRTHSILPAPWSARAAAVVLACAVAAAGTGLVAAGCASQRGIAGSPATPPGQPGTRGTGAATGQSGARAAPTVPALSLREDPAAGTLSVFRRGGGEAIVTQRVPQDARPYLHPIVAPDGRGVLTEVSPAHHPHQTGLYWGFTDLNGRDYFHHPGEGYWRRVSASVLQGAGDEVRWQTVYDLLDATGHAVLTETQRWSMREQNGRYVLGLEWRGQARTDVTIGKYDYGGLFLRMPWREGMAGEVVNAARQRNDRAEGQRAMWIDVGLQVEGRQDLAHIAIFDHPDNAGYPQAWRVDSQLGVGTARARAGSWSIARGATEIIRHQFVVYTGTLNDVEMNALWSDYTGNRSTYSTAALWGIAQREGREAKFLTADQAVSAMTLVPGYRAGAWAAEPMVAQPMAFCWDDRGRLWVAENLDYDSRGDGFSRAGNSRIVILEDTDRDGVADSRKVFMDGIVFPSALAVGFGGVFVGPPPNLLFIPDRDHDDRADVDGIEVRLTGWGIADRHEVMNSLHWGPDGWLYGLEGYATDSKIRKPVGKGRLYSRGEPFPADLLAGDGVEMNGGVWRYHPTKDVFEVVAHGFSNPWGIDYDAKGQMLISACVIPHLFHVVPGGIYQRQGGRHFNPYVYSDIQTIADHRHRSAHGGARVYQSDAFPASQQGRIFMANIHEHAVLSDVLERKGSSFSAHHGEDFLLANNAQWIGFSMEVGPDGALYVLDWQDPDICGTDVLQRETGRIYRIAPESAAPAFDGRYDDLGRMSDMQLVAFQTSGSDWHARRARVILQARAAQGGLTPGARDELRRLFQSSRNPDHRLRAMWALHVTGGWTPEGLTSALADSDEYVRAWAVQLLCEDRSPPPAALDAFARMARDDRSPIVRLYLAAALQRLPPSARWDVASPLMAHAEDAGDANLPTMIWLGVEPLVPGNPARALEQASASRIPVLARFIARRTLDADAIAPLVEAIGRPSANQVSMLEGMRDALEGRYDVAAPREWGRTFAALTRQGGPAAGIASDIARQFGDAGATAKNMDLVRKRSAPAEGRRQAVQILALQRRPQLVAALPGLVDEPALRVEAIRAIAAFDDEKLGQLLVARYASLTPAEKAEAIRTLAARPRYGRMLTDAIAAGSVPRADVPAHVARQLRRIVGPKFADVWGPEEPAAAEEKAFARYRGMLNETAMRRADPAKGHDVFMRTCGPCHKMYGEGGTIGPELTGSNRANLEYLLFNVLNPNGEVPEAYRMTVITTRDGRTLSGNITAETDRQVTLRVVGRDAVTVRKADIQSRETTAVSMMPQGLFDTLEEREVIDLVRFLRTAGPVKEP